MAFTVTESEKITRRKKTTPCGTKRNEMAGSALGRRVAVAAASAAIAAAAAGWLLLLLPTLRYSCSAFGFLLDEFVLFVT